MATYSTTPTTPTTMKVNRAISGATTVAANGYAIIDYQYSSGLGGSATVSGVQSLFITKYYGPSQSIPATVTSVVSNGAATATVTYALSSGVEFINTP